VAGETGAGAGAGAQLKRGETQEAAAGLHLPSMLTASRGPDRGLKLRREISEDKITLLHDF